MAGSSPAVIVTLPAEIDTTNAEQVHDLLCAAVADGAAVVVADLTATTFCDSRGINCIITARNDALASGCQLRLAVSPGGAVARPLELLGVSAVMAVYPN